MRLYNTYYICKRVIGTLKGLELKRNPSNVQVYTIPNWTDYRQALTTMRSVELFKKDVDEIYSLIPVFVREQNVPTIDADTMSRVKNKNAQLCNRVNTIIALYNSMDLKENKQGIDVKIPPCSELKEYINILKELDFIFTQCPYLLSKDEKIVFDSVDVGSNWLCLIIEIASGAALTFYILNNLAIIVDKAIVLKSHYNSIKEQEEALRVAENKAELAEAELSMFKTLKKYYTCQAVTELQNTISTLNDGEEVGKVEKTLEKLVDLMDKGVEIYASLDTPKDVQVLFPAMSETNSLPDNILKYLEDKNQTE